MKITKVNKNYRIITFGCWDLLHVGHVRFLQSVVCNCNNGFLIVGVASDEVVKKDKGKAPIISQSQRLEMLSALECVNYAFIYSNLSDEVFADMIANYQASALAVGGDWGTERRHILAEEMIYSFDGTVLRQPRTDGISTTQIINKILIERHN